MPTKNESASKRARPARLPTIRDVSRLVPGAQVVVQLDEPSLPAVLAGRIPTPSGFGTAPAIEESVAIERLAEVLDARRVRSTFR